MEELKSQIEKLGKQIAALTAEQNQAKQRLAEMQTPLKVGDRVTFEGAKCTWELKAIRPGWGSEPKFFGAKIKKDGTPGAVVSQIWTYYGKPLQLVEQD